MSNSAENTIAFSDGEKLAEAIGDGLLEALVAKLEPVLEPLHVAPAKTAMTDMLLAGGKQHGHQHHHILDALKLTGMPVVGAEDMHFFKDSVIMLPALLLYGKSVAGLGLQAVLKTVWKGKSEPISLLLSA